MFTAIEQSNDTIRAAQASRDPAVRSVRGRRPTGASTCQRIRATLRKALNDAILDGLLTRNPVTGTSIRADRAQPMIWTQERVDHWHDTGQVPGPVMVWTPAQTGAFLDHATRHDPDLYPLLHLIAHAGLRRGEAVGLRDVDVALDRAEITVTRQRVDLGDTVREKRPKTRSSTRVVALAAATVAVLRAARARRPQRREDGVFFVRPDGRAWHPAAVSRRFAKLIADAGLPPIRLHGLRHGAATLALAAGVDLKVIQSMLGHSSLSFTMDTYTSVVPELHHAAAEAVAALVPRRR
jgi:integrase